VTKEDPSVDEIARLIMSWMGLSMKLQRGRGEGIRQLADVGMTLQQIAALHVLRYEGALSVTTLTERLGLSLSATSHLVQRLVEQGLVTRIEDASDRRQKVIELTPAGKKMVEKMMQSRLDELRTSVRHLSDTVRSELAPVLRHVVDELSTTAAEAFADSMKGAFDWRSQDGNFKGQDLEDANLQGAVIRDARFDGSNLENAKLNGARLESARFNGANLEGAELAGCTLTEARFEGSNCERAVFSDSNLADARFEGSNLEEAVLDGANLAGARFSGCDLSSASFRGAELRGARFDDCELNGADFKGARNAPKNIKEAM
jgi:DNA-binding MarR family transcriptional regulator